MVKNSRCYGSLVSMYGITCRKNYRRPTTHHDLPGVMLLLNGMLSGLVSLFGTSELIKSFGIAHVLRANPICCFAMMGLFCCAVLAGEREGFLTVNRGSFTITRPHIDWNDRVSLLPDVDDGPRDPDREALRNTRNIMRRET